MNFKKWVKSIQTAGYNGARTVFYFDILLTNHFQDYFTRLYDNSHFFSNHNQRDG